jgi:hypothetical protein
MTIEQTAEQSKQQAARARSRQSSQNASAATRSALRMADLLGKQLAHRNDEVDRLNEQLARQASTILAQEEALRAADRTADYWKLRFIHECEVQAERVGDGPDVGQVPF